MTMNNEESIKKLINLAQLDIDAVGAYEQALKHIDDVEIQTKIESFRQDHVRHITDLSQEIRKLGGEPPKQTPDFKGFLITGFTALRSVTGTEGALKAMRGNEQLTNKTYDEAEKCDWPSSIQMLITKNRADERRHLAYIEHVLKNETYKTTENEL